MIPIIFLGLTILLAISLVFLRSKLPAEEAPHRALTTTMILFGIVNLLTMFMGNGFGYIGFFVAVLSLIIFKW